MPSSGNQCPCGLLTGLASIVHQILLSMDGAVSIVAGIYSPAVLPLDTACEEDGG
jgi:hypothetical protein